MDDDDIFNSLSEHELKTIGEAFSIAVDGFRPDSDKGKKERKDDDGDKGIYPAIMPAM